MKDCNKTDLGAEMLRVGRDHTQRLGRGLEQDGVDRSLVLERDRGDGRGQREDDMEIGRRQELDLPGGEPFGSCLPLALRAMPVATRVVGDAGLAAILAPLDMTAQRRGPAQRDGAHHAALDASEMAIVGPTIGSAVAAEDVRHFQTGRHNAAGSGRRHHLELQAIKRALGPPDEPGRDLRIARRARQVVVAKQHLDDADVGAVLQGCVAKLCRSVCTVTRLSRPDAIQAERQAECSTCTSIGPVASRPGNSQSAGRASRQ
jgi:hypothetical protein